MLSGLLPIICLILLTLIIHSTLKKDCWRASFLCSFVLWGTWIFLLTEVLSLFNSLTGFSVLTAWLALTLILIVSCLTIFKKHEIPLHHFAGAFSPFEIFSLISLGVIVMTTLLIAILFVPNNYDSMSYHMSRVMHWIQNENLSLYATQDIRQLTRPPWLSYAVLHFQLLCKSDLLANLVQWLSMLGSLAATSLIAKLFGSDRRGQILTAVACATIPMGILQSTSTQTDYAVSLWMSCLVYFLLKELFENKKHHLYLAGLCLGLALLTKTSAYLFALPFILWYLAMKLNQSRRIVFRCAMALGLLTLALNASHYARTFDLCQNLISCPSIIEENTNKEMSPSLFMSNIARNIALHWGTPFRSVNNMAMYNVKTFHQVLGISSSDERITYGDSKFHLGGYTFHEDFAGNFIHHLIFLCLFFSILMRPPDSFVDIRTYMLLLAAGFLLLNLYINWSPWESRYQLFFFVLGAPVIGYVASQNYDNRGWNIVFTLLIAASMLWVFHNQNRPLISKRQTLFNTKRSDQYFIATPGYKTSYKNAADDIYQSGCRRVGLSLNRLSWEYPLWALLEDVNPRIQFKAVSVTNESGKYMDDNFEPCLIVDNRHNNATSIDTNNRTYTLNSKYRFLNIYHAGSHAGSGRDMATSSNEK